MSVRCIERANACVSVREGMKRFSVNIFPT